MNRRRLIIGIVLLIAIVVFVLWRLSVRIDSAEVLGRYAVSALAREIENNQCEAGYADGNCSLISRIKRLAGISEVARDNVAVGNVQTIYLAFERINFFSVVSRTNDNKPDDSLLVRVVNKQIWLDFVKENPGGKNMTLSVLLESEGGTPVKLISTFGSESKEINLVGRPMVDNNKYPRYLIPEAGDAHPKYANWLYIPHRVGAQLLSKLFDEVRVADPAFIPLISKAIFSGISEPSPDEEIGLYTALSVIDRLSDKLRQMSVNQWLPQQEMAAFIKNSYADNVMARASWVLAMCEASVENPVIDENCWYFHAGNDADVNESLRNEVVELKNYYVKLSTSHPIHIRLNRLEDVLHKAERRTEMNIQAVSGS